MKVIDNNGWPDTVSSTKVDRTRLVFSTLTACS